MSKSIKMTIQIRADKDFVERLAKIADKVNTQNGTTKKYSLPLLTRVCNQWLAACENDVAMLLGEKPQR